MVRVAKHGRAEARGVRTKEGRELIKAIKQAGGEVTVTGKGHLRVVGPDGIAIVSSDPGNNSMAQSISCIRRNTGLVVKL